jgi:hypothetical protein
VAMIEPHTMCKRWTFCETCLERFFFIISQDSVYGNLSMKKGCLLFSCCLSQWDLPKHDAYCCTLGTIGKPLMSIGAQSWVHNVSTCNREIIEYWTIFSLKIHLNPD